MIELKDINKEYRKNEAAPVQALKNVSLTIQPGEMVAIVGPSGSGKSTLMHIMGLLDRPTSGSYKVDQKEVSQLSVDELARFRNQKIGFVFQAFHLLPRTSALENVELPLVYSDRSDIGTRAMEALKSVGLDDRAKHYPNELSGGQQQRVAIARALVNDPEVILADEPTGNLDSVAGDEIMSVFKSLHEKGRTIVLITHNERLAESAQRVIRIVNGAIVETEEPHHA